jgi:hypothetical protein
MGMDALSHRGTVVQPDKRSPLAVGRGSGVAYVGFVMVVAVGRWAAWCASERAGWSAVCSTPVVLAVWMPCGTFDDYQFAIWFT